jgi:glycosyltransferase involved in cell wall biosynthesis
LVSFPVWAPVALELRRRHGWPIVYDCHDHLAGFGNVALELLKAEHALIPQADSAVFSSAWLRDHHRMPAAPQVPNATTIAPRPRPRHSGRPVAGYIGAIEGWLDVELLSHAARTNPGVDFVLAGSIDTPAARALAAHANVRLLGEVAPEGAEELLGTFDVGLIPFRVNDLTRAADPIKLYEYFAFSLPVVSTALPEVERHGPLVYLASTPEAFSTRLEAALSEQDPALEQQRRAVAGASTWLARARAMAIG